MEREEDISLPHGSKDKLSDEKTVASDTNHVPNSLKETHSVQNPAMIAGNKLACENLLGGTITDRDKTEIETAAEESQYFEGESSSEMEIRPIASEPEVPSDKASSPKTAVLELSKPEKRNLEEGPDICSGGQPSCNADMEDHQLQGTENDICHEAQDECRKAAGDQLLEPEQTAFPEQRGQRISIEEASSADSDRLSKFYICSLCTFSCCLATDFTMHLNSCHDNEVDFVCYHCQYRGAYTTDLTNHITEHTISSALFWCPAETCTFRAESIRQLEPHIKAHSELVKCCCRTCKLSFASPTDLLNHFKEHSKTLFSCSRCPARFLSRAAIMHHCQQDHTGRCLFRVVGMLLCQQRMENGYEIFALHDMKLATETNEAMVEAASNSQDTNLTSINADSSTLEVISLSEPVCDSISRNILGTSCIRGDSIEYGSDQFKASKHISSQDSCGIKSPNPDESAGSKKAKSLRLSTENVSLVKGLLVEAVSSVRQEMCDKMGSIQDLDNKLTKEDSVSFHSVVSMPSTTVNAFVAEVDPPNNKQAENRCTGETSHEVLRQNQTKEEESHSDIPFVHSPTPIEPSLFSVAVPDATVADPASSRQTIEIAASHANIQKTLTLQLMLNHCSHQAVSL
ncbi:hypothetical protein C0Q70_10190 [Pomacea canaliculata]|uniref:C2H2-type domain-containing protein n=1 Tax=Pomacea canaliculata TaxID=400727 RepID=A0A2T7PBW6_POMCA|nr:uncharacterized protein LOC112563552 [Pomacea canaliculata]PVD30915.1 hypothetical protein C0Q70_10190 [Pomacea canaliculata]